MDLAPLKLGAHTSIAGGLHKALERGRAGGCDVIQVFTGSSRAWARRPIRDEELLAWSDARARTGVEPAMSHACYLINLATPSPTAWRNAKQQLALELERCRQLAIPRLVIHPGSHMHAGEAAGVARIARAVREVLLERPDDPTVLLLENTAGQGTCVGHRFEHLRDLLAAIDLPGRVAVCLDTQHLHAAGYPISSPAEWEASMALFERVVGPGMVRAWHVNDSLRPLGSRVDRHAHLGRGLVGVGAFRCLVRDPRFRGLPMALETPKETERCDQRNLRVLRRLDVTPPPRRRKLAHAGGVR